MFIRPYVLSDPTDTHIGSLGQEINNGNITVGKGLTIRKHGNGTILEATAPRIPNGMNCRGVYDFTQQYNVNDIVWVNPQLTYNDQNGSPLPFNAVSGSLPNLCAGWFVCVTFVPAFNATEDVLTGAIAPQYSDLGWGISDSFANNFRFYEYNVYYPICPLIPSSSVATISEDGFNVIANNTFWLPLDPWCTSSMCQGGNGVLQGWTTFFPSQGFDLTQLPYTGSGG